MFAVLKQNPLALFLAVLLHLMLLGFLIFGVDWKEKPKSLPANADVVKARVVDAKQLQGEIAKIKQAENKKKAAAEAAQVEQQRQLAALQKRREEEKRKLAELEKQRKAREAAEAKQRAEQKKRDEAEKKRLAELKQKQEALKKQQQAEQKRLAELAAKREADEKARREAEAKQKAAEAARKKAEEEARQKAEAEKKRREAEIAAKKEAERKRQEAAAKAAAAAARKKAEAAAREAELKAQFEAEQDASERARVVDAIQHKVQRNWLQPPGAATSGLQCTVRVRLGSSGSVLLVNVVKSSGNGAFDRSVEAAVRKADPLPMPESPRLQAQFRDLTFVFKPEE